MIDIKRGRYVEQIAEEWLDVVKDFFNTPGKPYIMIGKKGGISQIIVKS